ncbi:MAG: hypothetical protein HY394_02145 [Candidatus Diapherotrites archaeon]|nr:hypothetical protein [Candidatus Diapherotrites archaeon]
MAKRKKLFFALAKKTLEKKRNAKSFFCLHKKNQEWGEGQEFPTPSRPAGATCGVSALLRHHALLLTRPIAMQ